MHTSLRLIRVECYRQGRYIRSYAFNTVADAIQFAQESNLISGIFGNKYMLVVLS